MKEPFSELIPLLNSFWTEDYANTMVRLVKDRNFETQLYRLVFEVYDLGLAPKDENAVAFRSAYVLEHLIESDSEVKESLRKTIYRDFPKIRNESAKRHFCNILLLLLNDEMPPRQEAESIVNACMEWIEKPKTKIAVLVNAMEVIFKLRKTTPDIEEMIPDLLFLIRRDSTPGIESRIRKWRKAGYL